MTGARALLLPLLLISALFAQIRASDPVIDLSDLQLRFWCYLRFVFARSGVRFVMFWLVGGAAVPRDLRRELRGELGRLRQGRVHR
jgi:hypothetical protein